MTQLDLFAEDKAAERAQRDAEWPARFERADWIAPYDCGYGPQGTVVNGWRCPDPECGEIADNAYTLAINHGWHPEMPGMEPWDGRCSRLKLLESQARARAGVA